MRCLPITSSTKYLVEAGRINPETRFTAINTSPSTSTPRRGLISSHTCGRVFHASFTFLLFELVPDSFSLAIEVERSAPLVFRCPDIGVVISERPERPNFNPPQFRRAKA